MREEESAHCRWFQDLVQAARCYHESLLLIKIMA